MEHLLGAHAFVKGGVSSAIDTSQKLGFTAIQIFTKNNNQWHGKDLTEIEINNFKAKLKSSNIKIVVSHDSYLINLCAPNQENLEKSRTAFVDEIKRCEQLGIPYLNFHPGSHGGQGEEIGIEIIAESINITHFKTPGSTVLSMLETTAGQGTSIGHTFEQLKKIIEKVEDKTRICVCIDTAHIFAAGYDIVNNYENVIKNFDEIIGLNLLKCLHMNDSKKPLGSKVDRHEHIGRGFIGKAGFKNIMNDKRLLHIPKILETPKGKEQQEDLINIKALQSLIKKIN